MHPRSRQATLRNAHNLSGRQQVPSLPLNPRLYTRDKPMPSPTRTEESPPGRAPGAVASTTLHHGHLGVALALGASIAAAAALRFPFLGHQSLWYDETFTRAIVTA